jgi:hypothetical protein
MDYRFSIRLFASRQKAVFDCRICVIINTEEDKKIRQNFYELSNRENNAGTLFRKRMGCA